RTRSAFAARPDRAGDVAGSGHARRLERSERAAARTRTGPADRGRAAEPGAAERDRGPSGSHCPATHLDRTATAGTVSRPRLPDAGGRRQTDPSEPFGPRNPHPDHGIGAPALLRSARLRADGNVCSATGPAYGRRGGPREARRTEQRVPLAQLAGAVER